MGHLKNTTCRRPTELQQRNKTDTAFYNNNQCSKRDKKNVALISAIFILLLLLKIRFDGVVIIDDGAMSNNRTSTILSTMRRITTRVEQTNTWFAIGESMFENYDNRQPFVVTAAAAGVAGDEFIVPNIVHFLRFNQPNVDFIQLVCMLSVLKNHNPDAIYIHTNTQLSGKYWYFLLRIAEFRKVYRLLDISIPDEIFGQPFARRNYWNPADRSWHLPHASDVTRIRILQQYGGIFLDNDQYVVRNLDRFRRYEIALGWERNYADQIGTQIIISHPDSRFLKLWLESYRGFYIPNRWYYNAGNRPVEIVLNPHPYFVHGVDVLFGVDPRGEMVNRFYQEENWEGWRQYYAAHLFIHFRSTYDTILNVMHVPKFNEKNVLNHNFAIGAMAREVYYANWTFVDK